jgi:hypothetical protein
MLSRKSLHSTLLLVTTIGFLATAALAPRSVSAYQEAGHYYTVALLAYRLIPPMTDSDAHLIAFCAQLPDQSSDLDAVVVYETALTHSPFSWLSWAATDAAGSVDVRRMITVQQLLHGLTGGSADAVQRVAVQTVRELRRKVSPAAEAGDAGQRGAALCALGLALHLFGDSFAHQVMGDPGTADPNRVYPTGRGHAWDLHSPDLPLCAGYAAAPRTVNHCDTADAGRFLRWHRAWGHAAAFLGPGGTGGNVPPDLESGVTQRVLSLAPGASDSNSWNEQQMEYQLAGFAASGHPDAAFFEKHRSSEPCELVLGAAFESALLVGTAFTCKTVWVDFASVAAAAYRQEPQSRALLPFDATTAGLNPVL